MSTSEFLQQHVWGNEIYNETVTHIPQFLFRGKLFLEITNLKGFDTISRKYKEFNIEGPEWIKNII